MPTSPLSVANEYNDQGEALRKAGKHDKAIPWFKKAISIAEKELGKDHVFVSQVLSNLVLSLTAKGEIAASLKLLDRIVKIQRKELDPEDPAHADTLNRFAQIYQREGRYDAAIKVTEKALRLDVEALGKHHEKVGNDLGNLAALHVAIGRYKKAAAYFKDALEVSAINDERGPRVQFFEMVLQTLAHGSKGDIAKLRAVFTRR